LGIQVNLEISDSDFDKKSSSLYELSILIRMDSLVYAILSQEGKILSLKEYDLPSTTTTNSREDALKSIFDKDDSLKYLYRKCHIAFGNSIVTLVPQRLFNPQQSSTYLAELTTLYKNFTVGVNEIDALKTMVVFQSETETQRVVKLAQPNAKLFHKSTPFLKGCAQKSEGSTGNVVYANFWHQTVEVCYFKEGNLHFHNHFNYSTTPDCLYFMLLVFQQFDLNVQKVPLFISGQIVEDSEIYKSLYRYIQNIAFTLPPDNIQINSAFRNVPAHYYFSLFSLSLL